MAATVEPKTETQRSSMTPMLSLRGVSKRYTDRQGSTTSVLEGLDLDVADGEFVAVLGFSGSGKTTFCLLYTSPSPRDRTRSRMPSSA